MLKDLTNHQLIDKLSIDSEDWREDIIQISIRSEKKEIVKFLKELHQILCDKSFDADENLVVIKSKKEKNKEQFSTPYTLLDLGFDSMDLADSLRELTVEEYSETKIDRDDENPPMLFVFGKEICSRLIYIKLKIKGEKRKRVLCLSFHYAERNMEFPYS